jgi:MGT family glycosyltransferase
MSKVFFFNIPFHGHVNPSLALAEELVKRGEEVIYYCTDSFKEKIQSTGATFRSYSKCFNLDENFFTIDVTDIYKAHVENSALIMDEIIKDIENDKPDYIVHDSLCTWAKYAAQVKSIPAVNSVTTFVFKPDNIISSIMLALFMTGAVIKNIPNLINIVKTKKVLKSKYGVKIKGLIDVLTNTEKLNIVYTSEEFQPDYEKLEKCFKFVGPLSMFRNENNSRNFNFSKYYNKQLIFISMGTLFNNNLEFFDKCVDAFKNTNLEVFMSVGKNIKISELSLPKNFTVWYYQDVPQLELLKESDIFITHGGMNSTHEALYNGIPLIIIPQQTEQGIIATQVEKTGCGIRINKDHVTVALLKKTVDTIIKEKSYRMNAMRIRDSFLSSCGAKGAVDEIIQFVQNDKASMSIIPPV